MGNETLKPERNSSTPFLILPTETKSTQDTYRRKIKSKSRTSIRPRSLAWRLLEESSIRPRSLAWRLLEESWVRVEENQCTGGSPSRHRENEQTPFRQHQIRTCIAACTKKLFPSLAVPIVIHLYLLPDGSGSKIL
ncbi:uncharacterized protein [Narcine bancroftii]|uniref:uncharacterized protein isoform X11 n=1 Tax=Narcine bancroftii TaxID=1343680 RepID=UPI003831158E